MIVWRFGSGDPHLARQMASKTLIIGLILIGLGMLILAVPQLVVIPLAILFFIIGFFCLTSAWRLFWAGRGGSADPQQKDQYEDASFREIP
ncbi:MAG: hypothetical protein KC931_23635 [Candidatus Omnitrophica bacterium]|nr:hypothetical protein [Candidatus Omnitrophota bacterium]